MLLQNHVKDLETLDGIGPVMADSIESFFDSQYYIQIIQSMNEYNVTVEDVELSKDNLDNGGILSSESICFGEVREIRDLKLKKLQSRMVQLFIVHYPRALQS